MPLTAAPCCSPTTSPDGCRICRSFSQLQAGVEEGSCQARTTGWAVGLGKVGAGDSRSGQWRSVGRIPPLPLTSRLAVSEPRGSFSEAVFSLAHGLRGHEMMSPKWPPVTGCHPYVICFSLLRTPVRVRQRSLRWYDRCKYTGIFRRIASLCPYDLQCESEKSVFR